VTFGGAAVSGVRRTTGQRHAGEDASPRDYWLGQPDPGEGRARRGRSPAITDGDQQTRCCVSEVLQGPAGGDDIRGVSPWVGRAGAGFNTFPDPNKQAGRGGNVMTSAGGCGAQPLANPAFYPVVPPPRTSTWAPGCSWVRRPGTPNGVKRRACATAASGSSPNCDALRDVWAGAWGTAQGGWKRWGLGARIN